MPPMLKRGILLLWLFLPAACAKPELMPWSERFPYLIGWDAPNQDSLRVIARDSFPEIPRDRVNRALGRPAHAPFIVQDGHRSGYIDENTYGHMSMQFNVGGEVCTWVYDDDRGWADGVFHSCYKHTVGISADYEIHVVQSVYRPRRDIGYVRLTGIHVRVPDSFFIRR